jgi:hypothetical protein
VRSGRRQLVGGAFRRLVAGGGARVPGGRDKPRALPCWCWRRRRTPSWRRVDRWGNAVPRPNAPPPGRLSSSR